MPLAPDLLEILRCPVTGQRLALGSADLLGRAEARRREGTLRVASAQPQWNPAGPLEAILVREDGRAGYLVQEGIAILLPDHSIGIA